MLTFGQQCGEQSPFTLPSHGFFHFQKSDLHPTTWRRNVPLLPLLTPVRFFTLKWICLLPECRRVTQQELSYWWRGIRAAVFLQAFVQAFFIAYLVFQLICYNYQKRSVIFTTPNIICWARTGRGSGLAKWASHFSTGGLFCFLEQIKGPLIFLPGKSYTRENSQNSATGLDWRDWTIKAIVQCHSQIEEEKTLIQKSSHYSSVLPSWMMLLLDKLPFILIAVGTSFEDTFTLTWHSWT